MRKILWLGLFCLFCGPIAHAQVRVELLLDQEQYLPVESLPVHIRIHNRSGQTLKLGKAEEWLVFSVESEDGRIVKQLKSPKVDEEFILPSASRATKTVDIAPCFDLTRYGAYRLTASIVIPNWNQTIQSPPKKFYIMNGRNLQELTFGVPSEDKGRPEIRKFILVEANHIKDVSLYVRITDETETQTMSIFPIGPLITFSQPTAQLDQWNNLHLLYQDGARSFRYTMITPDGVLLARQTWDYTDSRPILISAEKGRIRVSGGIRRVSASDLPPPDLAAETDNPTLPTEVGKPSDGKKAR